MSCSTILPSRSLELKLDHVSILSCPLLISKVLPLWSVSGCCWVLTFWCFCREHGLGFPNQNFPSWDARLSQHFQSALSLPERPCMIATFLLVNTVPSVPGTSLCCSSTRMVPTSPLFLSWSSNIWTIKPQVRSCMFRILVCLLSSWLYAD